MMPPVWPLEERGRREGEERKMAPLLNFLCSFALKGKKNKQLFLSFPLLFMFDCTVNKEDGEKEKRKGGELITE